MFLHVTLSQHVNYMTNTLASDYFDKFDTSYVQNMICLTAGSTDDRNTTTAHSYGYVIITARKNK